MRVYLLLLYVAGLSLYAWRDWYLSLCGLVALLGIIDNPDVPRTVLGIPGLNPWNILLVSVVASWLIHRRSERLRWDMPGFMNALILLLVGVVLVSTIRMLADAQALGGSFTELVSEHVFNTAKWVVPGLLFFDGCRTRRRVALGLLAILVVYLVLALQITRWIHPAYVLDSVALERRSRHVLNEDIGIYRTDLAMMMAGGAWALVAARELFRPWWLRLAMVAGACLTTWALLLTASRAGYATWVVLALFFSVVKWRKALLLAPIVLVVVVWAAPGAVDRMLEGLNREDTLMDETVDTSVVTAGRTDFWPLVVHEIAKAPLFGHGRQAMIRTGVTKLASTGPGDPGPAHPHNLYLEILLDTGVVGFGVAMTFFLTSLLLAVRLLLDRRSVSCVVAGGVGTALLLAFLVSGVGGRHLYPVESTAAMWASLGLVLRVWVERQRARRTAGVVAERRGPPGGTRAAQGADGFRPSWTPGTDRSGRRVSAWDRDL
jgi:O-antigen ligase